MKNALLAFAMLLPALPSLAQTEFAPSGATWSYTFQTFWTSFNGFLVLKYEKDTLIGNNHCKKLKGSILDSSLVKVDNHDVFIRQSADSIFLVWDGSNTGYFCFKNNFELNETVNFPILWSYPLTVTAMEALDFGGQTTQQYTLESDGNFFDQTKIYEHFGPELGFFQNWWGVAVDGFSYQLLCYQDDSFPLAEIGNGPCFGLTPSVENELPDGNLSVFPNPASDEITFDFHGKNTVSIGVSIFDAVGKLLVKKTLPSSHRLDVSSLPNGIYLGNAVADGQLFPFKFVKQ